MWETANTWVSPRGNLSRWGACSPHSPGLTVGALTPASCRKQKSQQKHKQTQPVLLTFWSWRMKILDYIRACVLTGISGAFTTQEHARVCIWLKKKKSASLSNGSGSLQLPTFLNGCEITFRLKSVFYCDRFCMQRNGPERVFVPWLSWLQCGKHILSRSSPDLNVNRDLPENRAGRLGGRLGLRLLFFCSTTNAVFTVTVQKKKPKQCWRCWTFAAAQTWLMLMWYHAACCRLGSRAETV